MNKVYFSAVFSKNGQIFDVFSTFLPFCANYVVVDHKLCIAVILVWTDHIGLADLCQNAIEVFCYNFVQIFDRKTSQEIGLSLLSNDETKT